MLRPGFGKSAIFLFLPAMAVCQDAVELYRTGVSLFGRRQPQAAIQALQQSVALDPENAAAWKALGVVFASQGDMSHAEAPFRNACERQPSLQDACLYYGRTLYLADRFPAAIQVLRRAVAVQNSAETHRLLALSLEGDGKSAEAGDEFRTAIRLAANTSREEDPGIDYGVYLFRLGRLQEAIAPLEAVLGRHPDSARANLELGCVLLAADRVGDAAKKLERAVELSPASARAHLLLGKAYLRLGREADAETHLRQAAHFSSTAR